MTPFSIEVISPEPLIIYGQPAYWGLIVMGGFSEKFTMPLDSWTLQDYQQQWQEGRERIKTQPFSCVVATVEKLKTRPFIVMWALYKEGDVVMIRNQYLNNAVVKDRDDTLSLANFTPQTCYHFVDHPRKKVDAEGKKILEWKVALTDI